MVLDDWTLDARGQIEDELFDRARTPENARVGPLVTANSRPAPGETVAVRPGERVRLRLVNVCAARIAVVGLAGMDPLVVAVDGQASEVFPPAGGTVPIGPGARFEIVVDMPREAGKTPSLLLRNQTGDGPTLLTLATTGAPIAARPRVARLPTNPMLPTRIPLETSIKLNLILGREASAKNTSVAKNGGAQTWPWTIGGTGSDGVSGKPLFHVKRGHAVTLAFVNKTAVPQQMHIHGHVFRVLHDLDDGWDPYWRDSILIGPGKTKHVAFIADNPGKWALESLILNRQVTGMATWFEVG